MAEPLHPEELTALEAALRGLSPTAAALNPGQVLFRAGERAARRGRWLPTVLSGVAAAALAFPAGWLLRPPQVIDRVILVEPAPEPARELPEPPETSVPEPRLLGRADHLREKPGYLRLRDQATDFGVEFLPTARSPQAPNVESDTTLWRQTHETAEPLRWLPPLPFGGPS